MTEAIVSPVRRAASKKAIWGMLLLVVVLAVACTFLFWQYRRAVNTQAKSDKARIATITRQVANVVMLPNEEPTIATVADTRKVAEPQLAAQAQNGDEILVYAKAKRVILYRPSVGKIVDMFRVQDETATAGEGAVQGTSKDAPTTH